MRLRCSPASLYVRKVGKIAMGTGLDKKMEKIPTIPWDSDTELPNNNPIGKVPALEIEGGDTLFDSLPLYEFLYGIHDGDKLVSTAGGSRWTVSSPCAPSPTAFSTPR